MKYKTIIAGASLLLIGIGVTQAQNATNSSGGKAKGTGGTLSYSVGLSSFIATEGGTGSITAGVQHTYEITTPTGVSDNFKNISLDVYPNPTSDFLRLKTSQSELGNYQYTISDIYGRTLKGPLVLINPDTEIDLSNFPTSTYILSVTSGQKNLKTFKIIKK